jgi:hypothetical protein
MTAPSQGALGRNPTTLDFVQPSGFLAQIKKLPNVNFFMQEVRIPDISLPAAVQSTPFADVPWVGDNIGFTPLNIEFKVSEDFINYQELFNWITSVGFLKNTQEYGELARNPNWTGLGVYSDISIIPTDNLKNPNFEYIFEDCWPTFLGGFSLQTTDNKVQNITCRAAFKFTTFSIKSLK